MRYSLRTAALMFMAATLIKFTGNAQSPSIKSVSIGNQVWMADNLNSDKFQNGDPIPEAKSPEEWKKANESKQPAWCYYNNDPANGEKFGKLYNWYAVKDPRGIAPKGWHVPTEAEWAQLITHLGGFEIAGGKLKSTSGWQNGGNGTNETGFNGQPGGLRNYGGFAQQGSYGYWWRTSGARYIHCDSKGIYPESISETLGFSLRCVKD